MTDRKNLILTSLLLLVTLSGCKSYEERHPIDQCLRAELFKQCMASLPAGPSSTRYNDWDDVVKSCEAAAYEQSRRSVDFVKPECRP